MQMVRIPLKNSVIKAMTKDSHVSFNINRTVYLSSDSRRQVVILPPEQSLTVVPGVKKKENALLAELDAYQNRQMVDRFSFKVTNHDHSLLWRFKSSPSSTFENTEVLEKKESKDILKKNNAYQELLRSRLKDGNVFLMPDREISFGRERIDHHGYSRPVLILNTAAGDLLMVPFTTKLKSACPQMDIIIDPSPQGKSDLSVNARPAVERWPYRIFTRKTLLCVNAAQSISMNKFVETVLQPRGAVRKELVQSVRERLQAS